MRATGDPIDWASVELVVFDVDGTLYDQLPLRAMMSARLLWHALQTRSLETLRVLRTFRRVRERLGTQASDDFFAEQYERTARLHSIPVDTTRRITDEWIEQRPLPLLASCRLPGLLPLLAGLRRHGKSIAVFSDYPAQAKLAALGVEADWVACATDPEVRRLKPDPTGLERILRSAGVQPSRALMIGDRFDRDAEAAQRAGVRALIRARRPRPGIPTFRSYADAVFRPLLAAPPPSPEAPGAAGESMGGRRISP